MFLYGLLLGFALLLAVLARRCACRVEEGSVAALTSFGAAVRGPDKGLTLLRPGLHFHWPWQATIVVFVREQIIDLSGDEDGRTAMAEDGTVLRIDPVLRYFPVEASLEGYLFDLQRPREHILRLFTCLLRNEIANFRAPDGTPVRDVPGGSYAILRRERRRLNDDIEAFCHGEIGAHYGVRFNGVDLADILPPDELAEALNAMFQAQSEAEALLARAEAEREQRLLAAQKGVEIARQNARGAEEEILGLAVFLRALDQEGTLDDYVRRRRVEVLSECGALYLKTDDRRRQ